VRINETMKTLEDERCKDPSILSFLSESQYPQRKEYGKFIEVVEIVKQKYCFINPKDDSS